MAIATAVSVSYSKERTDRIYEEIEGNENREMIFVEQNQSYDKPSEVGFRKEKPPSTNSIVKNNQVERRLIFTILILFLVVVVAGGFIMYNFVTVLQLQNKYEYQRNEIQELKTTMTKMMESFHSFKSTSEIQISNLFERLNLTIVDVNQVRYLEEITMNFSTNIQSNVDQLTQKLVQDIQSSTVFESCAAIRMLSLPFPSGMYRLMSNNSEEYAYCSMEHSCNGVVASWRSVVSFNINNSRNSQCPNGLLARESPSSCIADFDGVGCTSVTYPINGSYSCVLGKIHGYQLGTPDGFLQYSFNRPVNATLNENYVDGVSLTHGREPRTHIWTFTAGSSDSTPVDCGICFTNTPSYIKTHYTCDVNNFCAFNTACTHNILWHDSRQCVGSPIFHRQLPNMTSDDIDMRVCRDEDSGNENILFTNIEIYVQ